MSRGITYMRLADKNRELATVKPNWNERYASIKRKKERQEAQLPQRQRMMRM